MKVSKSVSIAPCSRPATWNSDDDLRKWIFAHYLVGAGTRTITTQSQADWVSDIQDALDYGIDGWQLNFPSFDGSQVTNVANFVAALDSMGSLVEDFRFFPSFDFNGDTTIIFSQMKDWYDLYYNHPNHFRINGYPLLTIWQGRDVGNGQFADAKQRLCQSKYPIKFIPYISTAVDLPTITSLFAAWPDMDGYNVWVARQETTDALAFNENAQTACSNSQILFIPAVSFSTCSLNKSAIYIERNGGQAVTDFMTPLIDGTLDTARVIIVDSWNDVGEDHHITPFTVPYSLPLGAGTSSLAYNHQGYTKLLQYYSEWWKTGTQPTITDDTLIIFHRKQLVDGGTPNYTRPYSPDEPTDTVYVTALLKEAGTVEVVSGALSTQTSAATAGVSHHEFNADDGTQIYRLKRSGSTVIDATSAETIDDPPTDDWSWSLYTEYTTV